MPLPPPQLSTQRDDAAAPASSWWTDYRHDAAVVLLLLTTAAPYIVSYFPSAAKPLEDTKKIIGDIADPKPVSDYEKKLNAAWAAEADATKRDQLAKLVYMYRMSCLDWSLAQELQIVHDEFGKVEDKLSMHGALAGLRKEIAIEFLTTVPEQPPLPINEPLRFRAVSFLQRTIHILEKL